jgi:hypothetical protein
MARLNGRTADLNHVERRDHRDHRSRGFGRFEISVAQVSLRKPERQGPAYILRWDVTDNKVRVFLDTLSIYNSLLVSTCSHISPTFITEIFLRAVDTLAFAAS